MWEAIFVGLIVLTATAYATWRMLPASVRLRIARRITEWGERPGRAAGLQRAATTVAAAARKGVGACSDCSAVQAKPTPPGDRPQH